jgi:hypothetical protein
MIKEFIEINFPLTRLRSDLIDYLEEMSFRKMSLHDYEIVVFNVDDLDSEVKVININDVISFVSCKIECLFFIDTYYHLTIAVGDLAVDPANYSFFTLDKCLVTLKYNTDFSLYDADFYINRINKS